ncbi:MAG: type II toxin-antitoxin system RelE/ParE family toxin [Patescibacteria group bacterium]
MQIQYLPKFKKQFQKLPFKIQNQFRDRLKILLKDPTDARLRVHPLQGSYKGYWSMNVNGDIRALYILQGETLIIFALIGSHSQLYG